MSDPADGLPASLELHWDSPVRLAHVQLIFDTGLHRVLTLSHSDAYVDRMQYGRAQAETVRTYRLEGLVADSWQILVQAQNNYHRLVRHDIESAPMVDALRLTVEATHGLDHARVCEVRVYAQPDTGFKGAPS